MQREHRDGMVEGGVGKRQRASIANLEVQAAVAVAPVGMLDVRLRRTSKPADADDLGVLRQAEAQIAGATPTSRTRTGPPIPAKSMNRGARRRLQRPICSS